MLHGGIVLNLIFHQDDIFGVFNGYGTDLISGISCYKTNFLLE